MEAHVRLRLDGKRFVDEVGYGTGWHARLGHRNLCVRDGEEITGVIPVAAGVGDVVLPVVSGDAIPSIAPHRPHVNAIVLIGAVDEWADRTARAVRLYRDVDGVAE